jgi:hypothetical protein
LLVCDLLYGAHKQSRYYALFLAAYKGGGQHEAVMMQALMSVRGVDDGAVLQQGIVINIQEDTHASR